MSNCGKSIQRNGCFWDITIIFVFEEDFIPCFSHKNLAVLRDRECGIAYLSFLSQQKVNKTQKHNKHTTKKEVNTRFSRRQAGLTCKGSLVQVHSSTPKILHESAGFLLFIFSLNRQDFWEVIGNSEEVRGKVAFRNGEKQFLYIFPTTTFPLTFGDRRFIINLLA